MLEKMGGFFEARLDGYDAHMMTNIASAEEFYPFTARCLPNEPGAYFALNPTAQVTGIDLAEGMLRALEKKFPERDMTLICGSYFDGAVSMESLHRALRRSRKFPCTASSGPP